MHGLAMAGPVQLCYRRGAMFFGGNAASSCCMEGFTSEARKSR